MALTARRIMAMAAICAALVAPAAIAQHPVALVADVQGRAVLQTSGATVPLAILAELRDGARVRLDPGARLVALYVGSGEQYDATGPGEVQFGAARPEASGGASIARRQGRDIRLRATGLAQGGVVVRSAGLRLLTPVAATVLGPSPEFGWQDLRASVRYRFVLAEEGGPVVHETETEARSVTLPAGSALRPGSRYRWEVSAAADGGQRQTARATFRVAPEDLRAQADRLRPGAGAGFADRVVYALWLDENDLHVEARLWWRELSAGRPEDAALRIRASR